MGSDGPVKRNVIAIIIVGIIAACWLLYSRHTPGYKLASLQDAQRLKDCLQPNAK